MTPVLFRTGRTRRLALLALMVLISSGCRSGAHMQTPEPDALFSSVTDAAKRLPNLLWAPCQTVENDYRYEVCYSDNGPNLTESFRRLLAQLDAAGFDAASTGSADTELSASLMHRSGTARLTAQYMHSTLKLVLWDPEKGYFGSTGKPEDLLAGRDTYVRKDPDDLAKQVYYTLLSRARIPLSEMVQDVVPCVAGRDQEDRAANDGLGCFSARSGLTRAQFDEAFTNDFFAGNREYFERLNKQATFTYNEEPLMERKVIDEPAILVKKQSDGTYIVRDSDRYRNLEAVIEYRENGSPDLKVTMRALPDQ